MNDNPPTRSVALHTTTQGSVIQPVSDGQITTEEFAAGVEKVGNLWGLMSAETLEDQPLDISMADYLFGQIDTSNDGLISWYDDC
jgi:hypothetical protein